MLVVSASFYRSGKTGSETVGCTKRIWRVVLAAGTLFPYVMLCKRSDLMKGLNSGDSALYHGVKSLSRTGGAVRALLCGLKVTK